MNPCAKCAAELGTGRFCTNCGHRVGVPVGEGERIVAASVHSPLPDQAPSVPPRGVLVGSAAALVVVLLVVLASCLGGDDDTEAAHDTAATSGPDIAATTVAAPRQRSLTRLATASATASAPASRDLDGTAVDFEPANVLDGDRSTAWRTQGDGLSSVLTFEFDSPVTISRVGLVNGWAKQVEGVDWYSLNRRVTEVEWSFDDGTVVTQALAQKPRMQRASLEPVTTSTVRLRVTATTEPGAGPLGRDNTAISDVSFTGTAD